MGVDLDGLEKLEQMLAQSRLPLAETVPLFAALLSLPAEQYPLLTLTPQRQRNTRYFPPRS